MNKAKKTPSVADTAHDVVRKLQALRNLDRVRQTQHYFKHTIAALGIDAATQRSLARDWINTLKPVWTIDHAVALCDRLLDEPEIELRGAGILVLGGFAKEFTPELTAPAERWLRTRLDNWALVDSFCGSVLSPLLARHPRIEKTIRRWSGDSLLWVRRAALVTLVPFARRGQLLDATYDLAEKCFADHEDLMHKAVGWLLREAGKTDLKRLERFLLRHGPAIPRTALRYAIERFPSAARADLLRRTRPPARATVRRRATDNLRPENQGDNPASEGTTWRTERG